MSDIRLIELLTEALKREAAERERANKAEAALSEFQPIYRPPSGANAIKLYPGANMQFKRFIIPLLLSIALPASAGCIANDKWSGKDKQLHFIGGAMAGSFATVITNDPWKGFYTGAAVGVAKELIDLQDKQNSTCSLQDLFATVAGSALGAYTAGRVLINYDARQKKLNVAVAIPLQF